MPLDRADMDNIIDLSTGGGRQNQRKNNRNFSIIFVDFLEKPRIISSCMDTKKELKIPECGPAPELHDFNVVVGSKQLRKALNKGLVQRVFLALNADPAVTEPIMALCEVNNVSYAWVCTMQDLGRACGIEVGASAAAVLN